MKRIIWRRNAKVHTITLKKTTCELHLCVRHALMIFRCLGFFPVQGLWGNDIEKISYHWKSFYGIFNILTFLGQLALTIMSVIWCFEKTPITTGSIYNFVAYLYVTVVVLLLRNFAKQWPRVLKKTAKIESYLKGIRKERKTALKCNLVVYVVFGAVLLKNFINTAYYVEVTKKCLNVTELSSDHWMLFFQRSAPHIFYYTSFSIWKYVIYKIVNIQTTILCNILDIIVMCVSIYLASYFRDLNKLIDLQRSKFQNTQFWEKQRSRYTQLEVLVKIVNNQVKNIILLSFLTYSFFTCVELFYLMKFRLTECKSPAMDKIYLSLEHIIYFTCTILFPLIRSMGTCSLAANVHIEAQKSLIQLHEVTDYNLEIQRFRRQICYTPICLSGSLFNVTRNVILKIISTIITYELVLLQLNKNRRLNIAVMVEYLNGTIVK